jgi:hypothetical protein
MKTIQFKQWSCVIEKGEYRAGGPALHLASAEDGEPIATATVWLPNIPAGCVAIKNYSENEGMLPALVSAGVVSKPINYISSGFVTIPVCKLNEDRLVEFLIP